MAPYVLGLTSKLSFIQKQLSPGPHCLHPFIRSNACSGLEKHWALMVPSVTDMGCRLFAACRLKSAFPQVEGERICLFVSGIVFPNPEHKLNIHEPPIRISYVLKASTKSTFCVSCLGAGQSQVSALASEFPRDSVCCLKPVTLKAGSKLNKDKDPSRAV